MKIQYEDPVRRMEFIPLDKLEQGIAYWSADDVLGEDLDRCNVPPNRFFVPILNVQSETMYLLEYNFNTTMPTLLRYEDARDEKYILVTKDVNVTLKFKCPDSYILIPSSDNSKDVGITELLKYIEDNPGKKISQVRKNTGMGFKTCDSLIKDAIEAKSVYKINGKLYRCTKDGMPPLSEMDLNVLKHLYMDKTMTIKMIGDELKLDRGKVSKMLYRLKDMGVVERDSSGKWFRTLEGTEVQNMFIDVLSAE